MTPEHAIESFDMDNDNHISWDEFWNSWGEDDHDEHSHTVSVLYPDNTTAMFELDHDMLPENATGWDLTNMTMTMNNISLNYSVHEVYGTSVNGINGVDSPSDWSWWWSLQIWNETSEAWEASNVGIDSVMLTHDDNDHIAWAASTANMSLLEEPGHHDDHGEHDDDHGEHSHTVSVLYPDNTTAMFELDHDMLPENATGWDLTNMTMTMNNISLNYSVHEVYGTSVNGINGVDSPSDWSWWWSLQIWNETSEAWEASNVGIDSVMLTHDDNDHIAWAASTANMSLLEEPGHHDDHGEHDDDHGDEDHGVCYNSDSQMVSGLDNETTCEAYTYMTNVSWGQTTFTGCYNPVSHAADANMSEETCAAFMWMDEHSYDEMVALMGIFMGSDMDNDSLLSLAELEHFIEMIEHFEDSHDDEHAGHVKIHIEAEGDYGFALPHDVEFYVLMGEGGHDDHDDHAGHDDHGDHDEDDMVCYDMSTHTVDATHTTEADCENAGLMWTAANSGPGGDDHDDHGDEDDHDDHADEETLDYDPHSWLDPVAFKAQVDVVLAKLIEVFPEGEATFTENAEDFKAELDAIDDAYEAVFGENGTCAAEKTVAANHNAYSYIAVRYDIQFVTVHGLDPEGDPSPEDIANVVSHINEEELTVLFVEEYTDASSVGSIMQDTGVTIQYLYTMEMAPIDSSDNYLSLMNKNLDNLVAGIGC